MAEEDVRGALAVDAARDRAATDELKDSVLQRHRADSVGTSIARSFLGEDEVRDLDGHLDQDRYKRLCGCWWSGNSRVLLATAILFTTITSAQFGAAAISHSAALLADCISMAVDAVTYFMNIGVESLKHTNAHRPAQVVVPLISISLLTYFTSQVIQDAIPNLNAPDDDGDGVEGWIVFAFAVFGILFDVISIYLFMRNARKSGQRLGINMLAAFLHVGADFARSTTTFVESILILGFGFNSVATDAWACLIVSATILAGAVYAFVEWILDVCRGCKKQPVEASV